MRHKVAFANSKPSSAPIWIVVESRTAHWRTTKRARRNANTATEFRIGKSRPAVRDPELDPVWACGEAGRLDVIVAIRSEAGSQAMSLGIAPIHPLGLEEWTGKLGILKAKRFYIAGLEVEFNQQT